LYSYDITFEAFSETQADANGIVSADKIGPAIAKDMTTGAAFSVLFALIAMGVYIVIRFRRWQWALGATFALIHDAFMIVAVFSLFYSVMPFALEVNQAFIAAILTIIGYSINDTVVVFDRIREYIGLYPKRQLKDTINTALSSTLMRTLNTSGTTLVTLMAIFIFGGVSIRGFVFALIVGVVVGTYSSLFIASPLAYDMQRKNRNEEK
jgi:SecD/SecF fusion protein